MVPTDTLEQQYLRHTRRSDRIFSGAVRASTIIFVSIVIGLFVMPSVGSWPAIQSFGFKFLWTSEWNPVTGQFGALPTMHGTVVSSMIAIVLAGAVGIFGAAFLADFAPAMIARPLSFFIALLAAVPSVVFGLWGLFVLSLFVRDVIDPLLQAKLGFVPLFAGPIFGSSLFTAGIILAIMRWDHPCHHDRSDRLRDLT